MRHRLLDIAAGLAAVGPAQHYAVSHVSLADVAAHAGVSRGALYRLWPSQQEFWEALIEHLAVTECPGITPPAADLGLRAATEPLADAAQHALLADRETLLRTTIAAHPSGPGAHNPLEERRAARLTQLASALAVAVHRDGRRFVAGAGPDDLAVALTALGTGLPVTARMCVGDDLRFDSPWFDVAPGSPRSMLGVAGDAIRAAFTGPLEAGDTAAPAVHRPTARTPRDRPVGRRRDYLEIGAALAVTAPSGDLGRTYGHVTLDVVARAAGISRRAIGGYWPSQQQFRADLFAHLLTQDRAMVIGAVHSAVQHHRSGETAEHAFRALGAHLVRHLRATRHAATFRAFAVHLGEPALAGRARVQHARLADACAVQIHQLLAATNTRARAGVSLRQLALLLFAICDGAATLARTQPAILRDGQADAGPTVIERAIAVVLGSLTGRVDARPEVHRYVALIS